MNCYSGLRPETDRACCHRNAASSRQAKILFQTCGKVPKFRMHRKKFAAVCANVGSKRSHCSSVRLSDSDFSAGETPEDLSPLSGVETCRGVRGCPGYHWISGRHRCLPFHLSAERFLGDFLLSRAIRDAPAAGVLTAPLRIMSLAFSFLP
jgi:hypothetical protein